MVNKEIKEKIKLFFEKFDLAIQKEKFKVSKYPIPLSFGIRPQFYLSKIFTILFKVQFHIIYNYVKA